MKKLCVLNVAWSLVVALFMFLRKEPLISMLFLLNLFININQYYKLKEIDE